MQMTQMHCWMARILIAYIFIYKCITQYQGAQPFRLVSTSPNARGNNVNLTCPHYRTVLFPNSLLCSEPHGWNSLSVDIKSLVNNGNLALFKRCI